MKRLTGIACIGLLAIGLVAGCGSSDDDSLTKEEFLTKANAICDQGDKDIDAAANEAFSGDKEPTEAQNAEFATETVIPAVQSQVDQIRDLDVSSDDENQVNEILDSAQADIEKVKADPSLLYEEGGDNPFEETNKKAGAFGMTACAD